MPKGALYDDSVARLRAAGIDAPLDPGRKLVVDTPDGSVRRLMLRPTDVPAYVEFGAADVGITGADVLWEVDRYVCELMDLGFGFCRLAVAARRSDGYHEGAALPTFLRVATKFARSAEAYFADRDLPAEIIPLHGSVELAPVVGLADLIVDLVATGNTLREHDMVIVDEIAPSTASLRLSTPRCASARSTRRSWRCCAVSKPPHTGDAARMRKRRRSPGWARVDPLMLPIIPASDHAALERLYSGGWDPPAEVRETVSAIVSDVRARGDAALVEYARRFDAPAFSAEHLAVRVPPLDEARSLVPEAIAQGLALARERVARFHEAQLPVDLRTTDPDGTINALLYRPLDSVGAYVPGGTASLPSSVIMTVVPAKIAGVRRIVVSTPPRPDAGVNAAILYACSLCGVDELYLAGGAQAIAALAYGTPTIAPVDKIVGPGNIWVTEAKRQVFGRCGIDGLAGPSEVLVVADATAKPELVAGELLAQAEHDPLARVAAVSTERRAARSRRGAARRLVRQRDRTQHHRRPRPRPQYLSHRSSLAGGGVGVIDAFAPEHLALQVADPWTVIPRVRHAGAIFAGDDTPVAAGDYIAGSNHVLPTSGAARYASGLRTADFYRTMSLVENSRARMHGDREILATLARFEGLPAHARTALLRK